jgi:hypothetical protein
MEFSACSSSYVHIPDGAGAMSHSASESVLGQRSMFSNDGFHEIHRQPKRGVEEPAVEPSLFTKV